MAWPTESTSRAHAVSNIQAFVLPNLVTKGAFSQSARTAPIITVFIPGTPLITTHLQKDA